MASFKNLKISNWRQFENIDIELDSNITILTGKNGSGKTTLLNLLAKHFGWNIKLISSPQLKVKNGKNIFSDVPNTLEPNLDGSKNKVKIGTIEYDNDDICELITTSEVSTLYILDFKNYQSVQGINIPSHRQKANFNSIPNIQTTPQSNKDLHRSFKGVIMENFDGSNKYAPKTNPGVVIKESLLSLAIFGYGNDAVQPNQEYRNLFEGFQEVLRKVLPPELGFQKLEVRMPDIVLVTESGTFLMDAMSGGVNAIFTIAWEIFMFGADKETATILIDEPENHLHPSMQKDLMPNLSAAFPNFKFIISTHSPLIIYSSTNSKVYELVHNHQKRVSSTFLEQQTLKRFLMNQMLKNGLL